MSERDTNADDPGSLPTVPTSEAEKRKNVDPLLGTNLDGRFLLKMLLGRGGMGRVYLAEDQKLRRKVALKLMDPQLSEDREFKARFRREAVLQAQITHPGIVQVLDLGECPEGAYIILEFSDGKNLASILKPGKLKPDRALDLFEQMLDVVDFAHKNGIIHRDLKPNNILIEERGGREIVRVLDFGIAKLLTREGELSSGATQMTLTQAGSGIGTPGYVAFEQATGSPVDHRADVFSLGCILYQMLTGVLPHPARTLSEYMVSIAKNEVKPLSVTHPALGMSKDLDELLRRSLARDPEDRVESAMHFLQAIKNIRRGLPATIELSPTLVGNISAGAAGRKESKAGWIAAFSAFVLAGVAFVYEHNRAADFQSKMIDAEKARFAAEEGLRGADNAAGPFKSAFAKENLDATDPEKTLRELVIAKNTAETAKAFAEASETIEKGKAEGLQKKFDEADAKVQELRNQVDRLKIVSDGAAPIAAELSEKKKEIARLESALTSKTNEAEKAAAEVERLRAGAGQSGDLQRQLTEKSQALATAEQSLRSRESDLAAARSQVTDLQRQLSEAQSRPGGGGASPPIRIANRLRGGKAVVVKEITATVRSGGTEREESLRLPTDREILAGQSLAIAGASGSFTKLRVTYSVRKSDRSLDAPQSVEPETLIWKAGEVLLEIAGS